MTTEPRKNAVVLKRALATHFGAFGASAKCASGPYPIAMTMPVGEALTTSAGMVHSLVVGASTLPVPISRFTSAGGR